MADGFIWYELLTKDVVKAAAFYSKVVGWDVRDSGTPGMQYMLFGKDGKDVGGMMSWADAGEPGKPAEWMGHIHTAKLDEELLAVVADGGMVIKPAQVIPGVGRFAVVLDPQRVKYLLFEPGTTEAPPPRLGQMDGGNVGWHELLTGDVEQAFAYYASHYGWEKDYAHDMGPMGIYQTFRMGEPRYSGGIMNISKMPGAEGIQPQWKFYFTVDDVDAVQKVVTDAGGTILIPPMDVPGGSRVLTAVDDQGCVFALLHGPKG